MSRLVGARVKRVEDKRLLTGRAQFVDDLVRAGLLHAAFVRSPLAHGVLRGVDVTAAREAPGVVAVFTAADLAAVCRHITPVAPPGLRAHPYPALAEDRVRHVGEPVAIVVATSKARAVDAVELVELDVDPLPAVVTIDDALAGTAPPLWDDVDTNVVFERSFTYGDPDAAFARADRVVSARLVQHRVANAPLEGQAILADWSPAGGELVVDVAHQNPHALRLSLGQLLSLPDNRVRVRCADTGGSFGQKAYTSRELVAVAAASRLLGRPVKWVEERTENLVTAGHARDEVLDVEAAVSSAGELLGVRLAMTLDQGTYSMSVLPSTIFVNLVRVLFPSCYRLRDYAFTGTIVASNKGTYLAYRAPWESETWARERLLDLIAQELGLDPVEVRRRNLLRDDELPGHLVTGPTLDHVSARQTFERACELVDVAALRREQAAARAQGRLVGFGMSVFIEAAPGPPDWGAALGAGSSPRGAQRATARIGPDGTFTVFTSQQPHGQGHETTLAQLAAEGLGVPFEQVRVVHGDTMLTPFNRVGTGGSRSATMASGAVMGVAELARERLARIYAHQLEVDPADVEIADGVVAVRGVPSTAWDVARVAAVAYTQTNLLPPDLPTGLDFSCDFEIPPGGWAQATHCCWVEVDPETGRVEVTRYLVVEDCGTLINPDIVEGQVRGGVAQGIANVLLERVVYDDAGQPLTASFVDYLLPSACEIPPVEIEHLESPPQGPVNSRGVGEGGMVGAPVAVVNAIADALAPLGVRVTDKYLPPARVRALIEAAAHPVAGARAVNGAE